MDTRNPNPNPKPFSRNQGTIEKILMEDKMCGGEVYYKVRWENNVDTWVPKRNLVGTGLIDIFEKEKTSWFEVISPCLLSIIVLLLTRKYIVYSSQDKRLGYLPSPPEMLCNIIEVMAIQTAVYLTFYLFILKIVVDKKPKKLVNPYFELIGTILLIASYSPNYQLIFSLRTYIHIFFRQPKYLIMLDSFTLGLSWEILDYNMTNYKPTEGSLRFGLCLLTIGFFEGSRFIYFIYS